MCVTFYNFKGFYSMLFVHIVDHLRRHMFIMGGTAGATGDSPIINSSDFAANIKEYVPAPFHLLGDGGIMLRLWLITRYESQNGKPVEPVEQWFNEHLSNGRVIVEI